eukprot:CAMPEP_0181403998 /NCGR_PEP_ID=MMETSP1110-20121109/4012_1 /TAXON_ID=174948 /ORGANISM="Symbiodinium sp., Strain CCMP421" /LENGTH=45 /DNA_ID= /DNA_START= /DNA_END= /DNA_ORIENTATION=
MTRGVAPQASCDSLEMRLSEGKRAPPSFGLCSQSAAQASCKAMQS